MAKPKVEDAAAAAVTVGAAHKKYFYATFLWFPSGSIGNSGNNTAGQRLQWTQVRTGAARHLLHLLSIKWHFPWLPACLPVVFIPLCIFFFNFSISHSHFLLDLLVARAMRLISHYDWNVVFALCVTQTQTANGKNGRKMFWTAESWGGGWLGGEWCLSLTPRGVDGASLRSLVSHHQSLIPFIFSENNHFEATYGIRHDTTTARERERERQCFAYVGKNTQLRGGEEDWEGSGFTGTGAHGKGFPYVVSRPALSNYQMDSASEISGHVKWLYWFPLLVTRDSGGFSLLRTLFHWGLLPCVLDKVFGSR